MEVYKDKAGLIVFRNKCILNCFLHIYLISQMAPRKIGLAKMNDPV